MIVVWCGGRSKFKSCSLDLSASLGGYALNLGQKTSVTSVTYNYVPFLTVVNHCRRKCNRRHDTIMNTLGLNQKPTGVSLLCDLRGNVLELLCDEIGLDDKIATNQLFITAFDSDSREKATNFLIELKLRGITLDWALSVTVKQHPTLLHFSGSVNGNTLFIVGTRIPGNPEHFFNELMKINNEQANKLRGEIKNQVRATHNLDHRDNLDSKLYEELTQLNNELANT